VRFHSLGDVVLCSRAARFLAERHGGCSFLTDAQYAHLVRRMGDSVEPVSRSVGEGIASLRRRLHDLKWRPMVADLQGNLTSRVALFPSSTVRFRTDRSGRRALLSGRSEMSLRYRASDFLALVGGGESVDATPVLKAARKASEGRETGTRVGLIVGSRWPLKTIPEAVLAELCRLFCDILSADVHLIFDRFSETSARGILKAAERGGAVSLRRSGSTGDLLDAVESVDLLVSPDSGPAHVAAALAVPLLVVFTSTAPSLGFWLQDPAGYRGPVLYHRAAGVQCRPCHRHGGQTCRTRGRTGPQCADSLVPRAMLEDCMEVLSR
jgi:ADP-heptose:LPS heptosyltransferase